MNCKLIQRRCLEADVSDVLDDIQAHLDSCAACREWQNRLSQIEQQVPLLPVPPSMGRDAFMQGLLSESPALVEEPLPPRAVAPPRLRRFSLPTLRFPSSDPAVRRLQYAMTGLAASFLLCLLASWSLWSRTGPSPLVEAKKPTPDPLVAGLMQNDLILAVADTPRQRAETLNQMAGDMRAEMQALIRVPGAEELLADFTHLHTRLSDQLSRMEEAKGLTEPSAGRPSANASRVQQLKRNRELIVDLVNGGLRLAGESEPIKRANCCKDLAQRLAGEVRQAASKKDRPRAVEMGQHLHDLLETGIASNLSAVRASIPANSLLERDMLRVGEWVTNLTQPLEEHLARLDDADLRQTLAAIHDGRARVENAIRG